MIMDTADVLSSPPSVTVGLLIAVCGAIMIIVPVFIITYSNVKWWVALLLAPLGVLLLGAGDAISDAGYTQKHRQAEEMLAAYGIASNGENALDILFSAAKSEGITQTVIVPDGDTDKSFEVLVKDGTLSVYEQNGSVYTEVSPTD